MADLREKEQREALEREHQKELAEIEAEMEKVTRERQEEREAEERANVLRQRRADLAALRARLSETPVGSMSVPQPEPEQEGNSSTDPSSLNDPSAPGLSLNTLNPNGNAVSAATLAEFTKRPPSKSADDWRRQKTVEGAFSPSIDAIMAMVGLESVKAQVLAIKAKIDTAKRQCSPLEKERFNISFLGNPGTGTSY